MNINAAKEDIKNTVQIYLKKDEFGDYRIPVVRQRPVFLLGAPGIGKTAIMEQIAAELGIALVSYSMTHHTRQSALGLPFIKEKQYGEMKYDVSEYTMSEIISSVYETMEASGVKEGILFLDEINCVSETLAPSMLQFLQYKTFGKHVVPEGWVIVTAGNPPMYNKSVREFDVVTMDRLKVIEVEADYDTWKRYAMDRNINPAVTSFLELKREFFYHMETTVKGRSYITARGWEDLSEIINLYEEDGLKIDESLVEQYLRNENVVKEFCAYYDLYQKYKNDYKVDAVLAGNISEAAINKAREAAFDERLSLVGMLLDKIQSELKSVVRTSNYLKEVMTPLRATKELSGDASETINVLKLQAAGRAKALDSKAKAGSLTSEEKYISKKLIAFIDEARKEVAESSANDTEQAFAIIKNKFDGAVADMKASVSKASDKLHNMFEFVNKAFENGNEMLIVVTELTAGKYSSAFIGTFGSEDYQKYNKLLMISERRTDMKENILKLQLVED